MKPSRSPTCAWGKAYGISMELPDLKLGPSEGLPLRLGESVSFSIPLEKMTINRILHSLPYLCFTLNCFLGCVLIFSSLAC